jgi:xanthine dehydrogenase accessory factor
VLTDGAIEGFVGGNCAESSVRVHALEALGTGDPLLLRIEPGAASTRVEEGAITVANPCLSGGSLEIFLEPRRPAPRLVVVGETPIAAALSTLGGPLGFSVEADGPPVDAAAVVVASHGRGEEPALEAALRADVPYVGLVASKKRGAAVVASLGVAPSLRERVRYPAGLDLGGRSAPEIALSILAEIVSSRYAVPSTTVGGNAERLNAVAEPPAPPGAVDPICGMTVLVTESTSSAPGPVYFCSEGCRRAYLAEAE